MTLKRKKILLIFPGLIALFGSLLIIVLFIDVNKYKPRIEKAASDALRMDVRIEGKIRTVFFPCIFFFYVFFRTFKTESKCLNKFCSKYPFDQHVTHSLKVLPDHSDAL